MSTNPQDRKTKRKYRSQLRQMAMGAAMLRAAIRASAQTLSVDDTRNRPNAVKALRTRIRLYPQQVYRAHWKSSMGKYDGVTGKFLRWLPEPRNQYELDQYRLDNGYRVANDLSDITRLLVIIQIGISDQGLRRSCRAIRRWAEKGYKTFVMGRRGFPARLHPADEINDWFDKGRQLQQDLYEDIKVALPSNHDVTPSPQPGKSKPPKNPRVTDDQIMERLAKYVQEGHENGDLRWDQRTIAAAIGISERTLQRKLKLPKFSKVQTAMVRDRTQKTDD